MDENVKQTIQNYLEAIVANPEQAAYCCGRIAQLLDIELEEVPVGQEK
jgi:hypothetical protein